MNIRFGKVTASRRIFLCDVWTSDSYGTESKMVDVVTYKTFSLYLFKYYLYIDYSYQRINDRFVIFDTR